MNDVEEKEGLPSLDKPGWYSQGNWPHLHELLKTMTGKPEPKVGQASLYITGAISPSSGWVTSPAHFEVDPNFGFGRGWKRLGLHDKSAQGDSHWCDGDEERGPWHDCRQGFCVPACWELTDETGQVLHHTPLIPASHAQCSPFLGTILVHIKYFFILNLGVWCTVLHFFVFNTIVKNTELRTGHRTVLWSTNRRTKTVTGDVKKMLIHLSPQQSKPEPTTKTYIRQSTESCKVCGFIWRAGAAVAVPHRNVPSEGKMVPWSWVNLEGLWICVWKSHSGVWKSLIETINFEVKMINCASQFMLMLKFQVTVLSIKVSSDWCILFSLYLREWHHVWRNQSLILQLITLLGQCLY